MRLSKLLLIWPIVFLIACSATPPKSEVAQSVFSQSAQSAETPAAFEQYVAQRAQSFFAVYASREDFDGFLAFYAEDAQLEDLVYGQSIKGKTALRGFFRWDSDEVTLLHSKTLEVTEQVVDGGTVVTRGVFLPFLFHGEKLGPWRFVIWQEFNQDGLVIKQFDWINYTPKEMFVGGENLNQPQTLINSNGAK